MEKKITPAVHCIIHILECIICFMTLIFLAGLIVTEGYKMCTSDHYFFEPEAYLQSILTIVVGLEFVRTLVVFTPENTLKVVMVVIARHAIVNHNNVASLFVSVLCIGGLFAIRRFLMPHPLKDKTEINENE